MLRFLLFVILFIIVTRLFWRLIDGVIEGVRGGATARSVSAVKLVRDPVCGTFVTPTTAISANAGGSTHYFCSDECRQTFEGGRGQGEAGSRT
jgi:YHS domain-containing protein